MVWAGWYGACQDRQGAEAGHPDVRRNNHIAHEGMSQPLRASSLPILPLLQPENQHVKFNVDVKVQNDPDRLFALMNKIISSQPDWEKKLAPRILVGLWHPRFLSFAKEHLPYCRRSYIGNSPYIARKYFWNDVDAFSMAFSALTTMDGQK